MRLLVIVLLAIGWLGTRLLASPANKLSPAQAANAAKVDRNYRSLVHRLRARARRTRQIRAARAAWAHHADRICARTLRRLARAARPLRAVRSKAELRTFMSNVEAIEAGSLEELRALPPPSHDRARVRKLIALREQADSILQATFAAIQRRDPRSFVRLVRQGLRVRQRADRIAAALGADVCGQGPLSSELG